MLHAVCGKCLGVKPQVLEDALRVGVPVFRVLLVRREVRGDEAHRRVVDPQARRDAALVLDDVADACVRCLSVHILQCIVMLYVSANESDLLAAIKAHNGIVWDARG